jgi:hypothetical protein
VCVSYCCCVVVVVHTKTVIVMVMVDGHMVISREEITMVIMVMVMLDLVVLILWFNVFELNAVKELWSGI